MDRPPLRIAEPSDLDPLGAALSSLGVACTLVDRDMKVRWANDLVKDVAEELSCGGHHCFQSLWRAGQRCPDCLPLVVFRTGKPHEGVRERGLHGGPPEAFRRASAPRISEPCSCSRARSFGKPWRTESRRGSPAYTPPTKGFTA